MNFSISELPLPFRLRTESPLSDEELMRFSAANETLRVEREPNGELLIMSPSGSDTSRMNMRLGRILDEWAEADGRGVAFESNGGFTLPDGSVRAADAAWAKMSRWMTLTEAERASFAPLCPDFVIELRSPSDSLRDLAEKMRQWMANGAQLGWLIDPIERTVTIYREGDEPEILHDPTSVQGTGGVAGFELVMGRVWG
jgi:Uma2 family endonuclease